MVLGKQLQPKHVSTAMNKHNKEELLDSQYPTIEKLWEMLFAMQSMMKLYNKDSWTKQ
jgi:hypothetical protein